MSSISMNLRNVDSAQIACVALLALVLWSLARRLLKSPALSDLRGPAPSSWWSGHFLEVFNRHGYSFHADLAQKYGSVVRLYGYFGKKQLYVFDPLAMHHIFVKNQYVYEPTDEFIVRQNVIFGPGLLSTLGDHHRRQRKMLNPVFSLKHMRGLVPVFYPIAHRLHNVLANEVAKGNGENMDVMKWISRAALEYIGQGGLGYSFDALDEGRKNTYSELIKSVGPAAFDLITIRQLLPYAVKLGPAWLRRELVKIAPIKRVRRVKEFVDEMDAVSRGIFEKKKDALVKGDEEVLKQVGGGKDIMSVLLRANVEAEDGDRLPEEELLAQMNTFILAGHSTTSSAICRILHQLVLHPEVQDKLRVEVTEARAERGDLDYDTLMSLPYLDAVCRETLRFFAPVPTVMRATREDIVLPLAWPIKSADGKREITSIPLEKGTDVIISIYNANRSTRIWGPDAEEWKPERWLSPLPESVAKAHMPGVYASMMTFIGGGRACIGFKFAEMEMKLVLSILLPTFVFYPGTQEVEWHMTNLQMPSTKGSKDKTPKLPLSVGLVKDRAAAKRLD